MNDLANFIERVDALSFGKIIELMDELECWRDITGHPEYRVSSWGRVQGKRVGILRTNVTHGYHSVSLSTNGVATTKGLSRLVLQEFVGPAPFPDAHAAHGDGDKANNRLINLRWATAKENQADVERHGTRCKGSQVQPPPHILGICRHLGAADLDLPRHRGRSSVVADMSNHIEKMGDQITEGFMLGNEHDDIAQAAFDALMDAVPDLVWEDSYFLIGWPQKEVAGFVAYNPGSMISYKVTDRGMWWTNGHPDTQEISLAAAKSAANTHSRAQVAANWPDGGAS